jgi:hypothetical protein
MKSLKIWGFNFIYVVVSSLFILKIPIYQSYSEFCGLFPLKTKSRKRFDFTISTKRVLFTILIWGLQKGSPNPSAPTGTRYKYLYRVLLLFNVRLTNSGTDRHCNYTCILCIWNAVVRSTVKSMATIGIVEVVFDKFNLKQWVYN